MYYPIETFLARNLYLILFLQSIQEAFSFSILEEKTHANTNKLDLCLGNVCVYTVPKIYLHTIPDGGANRA